MALRVYQQYFGKPFIPKNYDDCIENQSYIIELDDINKIEESQPEN